MAQTTKDRIIEATLATLKEEGFSGTSARAIARKGDFNQALIFYHFGTLNELLLAALDRNSEERLDHYRGAIGSAVSLDQKISAAAALYKQDLAGGNITVLSELVAGSLTRPDLGPEVVERMEPWVEFAQNSIGEMLEGTPLAALIPPRTAAVAVVALYLGIDLLAHLDRDHGRAEALFDLLQKVAALAAPMLSGGVK